MLQELITEGCSRLVNEKDKKIGIYYISEASKCVRQAYYSYFEKPKYGFEQHKAFSIGNALHELTQTIFMLNNGNGIKVFNEVPNLTYYDEQTGLEIHGRLDTLLEKDGKQHIIEIKTISNLKYSPIDEHFEQLNYYLRFYTGAEGHLFYINKAKKSMYDEVYVDFKEIPKEGAEPITYNEELFQHSLSRIRSLHSYCIKEEVPPPEAKQNSDMFWQCNFCPFIVKCNKEMV